MVARRAHNPEVGGSNPSPASIHISHQYRIFTYNTAFNSRVFLSSNSLNMTQDMCFSN